MAQVQNNNENNNNNNNNAPSDAQADTTVVVNGHSTQQVAVARAGDNTEEERIDNREDDALDTSVMTTKAILAETAVTAASEDIADEKDASLLAIGTKNELPLQFRWALWYSAPKNAEAEGAHKWERERAKQIVEFGSVEEFWRVFNNLCPPSKLQNGADFQLFRSGVNPAWEDSFNAKGGAWTIKVAKDNDGIKLLDTIWFNTVLTMIGDNFDDADDICGIAVSARGKFNRVQLWTRYADDRDACLRIGLQLKDINRLKNTHKITFVSHDDARDFSKVNKPSEIIL